MAKKDVELFFQEVNKSETLKKELEKAETGATNIKGNEAEAFFNKKISPIVKKYGFSFSYDDLREFKHSLANKGDGELSDDFLDQVAGGAPKGEATCWSLGVGVSYDSTRGDESYCFVLGFTERGRWRR